MAKLRVRMLAHLAGPEVELVPGSEYTLDADLAGRLVDAEYAVAVTERAARRRAPQVKAEAGRAAVGKRG